MKSSLNYVSFAILSGMLINISVFAQKPETNIWPNFRGVNCLGHQNDPRILAINKFDGSIVWKYSLTTNDNFSGDSYSTPVIYKNQVIVYASDGVSGYNLKTGNRIWNFAIGVTDAICTPVLGKETIYTTTYSTRGNLEMLAQFPDFKEIIKKYDLNKNLMLDKTEVKNYPVLVNPEMSEISQKGSLADFFGFWDSNRVWGQPEDSCKKRT